MKEVFRQTVAQALAEVPAKMLVTLQPGEEPQQERLPSGRGRVTVYKVAEGVEAALELYLAEEVPCRHDPAARVLEVDHCRQGRIGWAMGQGEAIYFGRGDLCCHTLRCCAGSRMVLPLGCYEGIALRFDWEKLETHWPSLLKEAGVTIEGVAAQCRAPGVYPQSAVIDGIFHVLHDLPQQYLPAYLRLKAQEVLLFLSRMKPVAGASRYALRQAALMKEVREELVAHLDQRITIETLAKKYLMNTSTLKEAFKAVYGMPIASYMKAYRMQQAMHLLRQSEDSIAAVARQVGYESQGKFSRAFQAYTGCLPTQYRRSNGTDCLRQTGAFLEEENGDYDI